MKTSKTRLSCLNATQLKFIALISMTIDHFVVYGQSLQIVSSYYDILRMTGRIAAVLFMYIVIESAKHTRSKIKFFIRLYITAVSLNILAVIMKHLFNINGPNGSIFFSYAWTVLLIILFDLIIKHIKSKDRFKAVLYSFGMIAGIFAIHFIEHFLLSGSDTLYGIFKIFRIFVISIEQVDYSLLFILLGLLWYFTKSKYTHSIILLVFCLISLFGITIHTFPYTDFIQGSQWTMAGAIPFILLYNGERGKGYKYLFYIYYPLHAYIFAFIFSF